MRRRPASPIPAFDVVPATVVDAAKQLFDFAVKDPNGCIIYWPVDRTSGFLSLS